MERRPESAGRRRSMVIFRRAVSALWRAQETRLECFKKVIAGKLRVFKNSSKKWKVGDGMEVIEVVGICAGFL